MALPALHFLLGSGLAVEVALPDVPNPDTPEIKHFLTSANKPFTTLGKQTLAAGLKRWIERHKLDVVFVITFPWKIPEYTLNLPPFGFFNFHFALLPQYRGPSPVFWQLKNGEQYGGLTIHRMDAGLDTGPIALVHKVPITPGETFGFHTKNVAWQAVSGVQQFVQKLLLLKRNLPLEPQDELLAKYYPRPVLNDISVNWQTMSALQVKNLVDACNPWNKGAYSFFNKNVFKIIQVSVKTQSIVYNQKLIPGTVIKCSENKTVGVITVDNKTVSIEIISVDEGIFTADFMLRMGVKEGVCLADSL